MAEPTPEQVELGEVDSVPQCPQWPICAEGYGNSSTPQAQPEQGEQDKILPCYTPQTAIEGLSKIFLELQTPGSVTHDAWDWMEAEVFLEVLRSHFAPSTAPELPPLDDIWQQSSRNVEEELECRERQFLEALRTIAQLQECCDRRFHQPPTAAPSGAAPAMTVEQQMAQIRKKLAEHTIGSDNNTHRVNNPVWNEEEKP